MDDEGATVSSTCSFSCTGALPTRTGDKGGLAPFGSLLVDGRRDGSCVDVGVS